MGEWIASISGAIKGVRIEPTNLKRTNYTRLL